MKHYVAYHKVEEYGPYDLDGSDLVYHFTRKPIGLLRKTIGQTLWAISGARVLGRMIYKLCSVSTPQNIDEEDGGYIVEGMGKGFVPQIELNHFHWFSELLIEQNNFSLGLNEIKNKNIIKGLTYLDNHGPFIERLPDEISNQHAIPEGAKTRIMVNSYERSAEARIACISHYGYNCAVCEFNFEDVYGNIGGEYIHVHHIVPLSSINKRYKVDPIVDLRPVCPNCHAMLHRRDPPYSVKELRSIMKRRRQSRQ